MKVKMIRDCGAFKKGQTYDLGQKKSTELLTGGFCVRVNSPSDKVSLAKQDTPVKQKNQENEEATETSDFKDKNKGKK